MKASLCLRPELEGKHVSISPDWNVYNDGDHVSYSCHKGYFSDENRMAECLEGQFDPSRVPTCRSEVLRHYCFKLIGNLHKDYLSAIEYNLLRVCTLREKTVLQC